MPPAPDSPIGADEREQIRRAREAAKGFLGARKVARFNGYMFGAFAGVSLLFGMVDATSAAAGLALGIVARNEFHGRRLLMAFDPVGPRLLVRNQVSLIVLVLAYCGLSVYQSLVHPDPMMSTLTDALGEGGEDLVQQITLSVYGSVATATLIVQGLNARYYATAAARLDAYLRDTPAWIVDLEREDDRRQESR